MAHRTSPDSVLATELPARSRSNEAASMRSTAETTSAPSSVRRVPWTSRVNRVAPICRSKSSILRRTPLMESSSRSAADLKLPQRTTSRKTLAASQSVNLPRAALWRSSWGTPLSSARCIHPPFRLISLAEFRAIHNHDGSRARIFTPVLMVRLALRNPGIAVPGLSCLGKGSRVTSVISLRTFANSSSVPIVVFVDMQQEYLAKPRLFAISEIDHALDNCRRVLDHSRKTGLPSHSSACSMSRHFSTAQPHSSAGSRDLSRIATKWCSNEVARHATLANPSPLWLVKAELPLSSPDLRANRPACRR